MSEDYITKRRPSFISILIAVLLGGILIALIAGLFMVNKAAQTVEGGADRVRQWGEALVKQATPTIWLNPATIIHEVLPLSRLETVSYSVEKVVTVEKNQQGLADILGLDEKLLFVAHGKVIAGIDLGDLVLEDITVTGDTVILTLPKPQIFISTLDNDQSYVYDHERGILNRVFEEQSEMETMARRAAEDAIEEAAIADGILETADLNGQQYLRSLILALGYENVFFADAIQQPNLEATGTPAAQPTLATD
ncbi:MAG: DUF4230 domain-containing protein [Anaerolineales bacterium]|nr:DUF4230 domain-containing protein [Anaerolineales bacterium]